MTVAIIILLALAAAVIGYVVVTLRKTSATSILGGPGSGTAATAAPQSGPAGSSPQIKSGI